MRMRFDEAVQRSGVTRAHWTLIAAAARIPGATQKTIAQALQISEVSAGRLIDKLCNEGLLKREPCSHDRRAYRVSTTARAKPLLKELSDIATAQEECAFDGLSQSDLETLERVLGVIYNNIETRKDDRED